MSAVVQEKLYSVQVGRGAGPSVKLEKLKISRLPLCNNTTTAIILCKDYLKNISAASMQQHHQQQGSQIIFTRPKKNSLDPKVVSIQHQGSSTYDTGISDSPQISNFVSGLDESIP